MHPTFFFVSMTLLQMSCVMTWAQSFLTSEVMEAVRGQKHRWEAKKGMKELIYQKKYLTEVSQQSLKPLKDPIKFELRPQTKKIHPSDLN